VSCNSEGNIQYYVVTHWILQFSRHCACFPAFSGFVLLWSRGNKAQKAVFCANRSRHTEPVNKAEKGGYVERSEVKLQQRLRSEREQSSDRQGCHAVFLRYRRLHGAFRMGAYVSVLLGACGTCCVEQQSVDFVWACCRGQGWGYETHHAIDIMLRAVKYVQRRIYRDPWCFVRNMRREAFEWVHWSSCILWKIGVQHSLEWYEAERAGHASSKSGRRTPQNAQNSTMTKSKQKLWASQKCDLDTMQICNETKFTPLLLSLSTRNQDSKDKQLASQDFKGMRVMWSMWRTFDTVLVWRLIFQIQGTTPRSQWRRGGGISCCPWDLFVGRSFRDDDARFCSRITSRPCVPRIRKLDLAG
jgi:hypothetical protein